MNVTNVMGLTWPVARVGPGETASRKSCPTPSTIAATIIVIMLENEEKSKVVEIMARNIIYGYIWNISKNNSLPSEVMP